jgi:hypothetical protein
MSHYTTAKQSVQLLDEEILLAAVRDAAKEIAGTRVQVSKDYISVSLPRGYMNYSRHSTGWQCNYDTDYTAAAIAMHHSVERQYKAHTAVKQLRHQGYVGIKIVSKPSEEQIRVTARRV